MIFPVAREIVITIALRQRLIDCQSVANIFEPLIKVVAVDTLFLPLEVPTKAR